VDWRELIMWNYSDSTLRMITRWLESKKASHDKQYDIKEDHIQGTSEVNPVCTGWLIWLFYWVIVVEKEEKMNNIWHVQNFTSPFTLVFQKQESKCVMVILCLIFRLLFDILYISSCSCGNNNKMLGSKYHILHNHWLLRLIFPWLVCVFS